MHLKTMQISLKLPIYVSKRCFIRKHLTVYQKKLADKKAELNNMVELKPTNHIVSNYLMNHETTTKNDNLEISHDISDAVFLFKNSSDISRKLLFYGSENSDIKKTDYDCKGCGSNLQCASMDVPGYIPSEIYAVNCEDKEIMENMTCIRCFFLQNGMNPLDLSVEAYYYTDVLQRQMNNDQSLTILLLCDMADLPHSVCLPSEFLNHLQSLKDKIRIILVGNKIDLLNCYNKESKKYLRQMLVEAAKSQGIPVDEMVSFTQLVSGQSSEGIDELIDRILHKDFYRNEPMYIVGSANVGKSTIFNRLLESDFCKTLAKKRIRKVMVSKIPGTTLSVLKFPMVSTNPGVLQRRLMAKNEGKPEKKLINTQVDCNKKFQDMDDLVSYAFYKDNIVSNEFSNEKMKLKYDKFDESKITTKKWCYDTPGLINQDQIINYLDTEQLRMLDFNGVKNPRIFILTAGMSLLLKNLVRIDILEPSPNLYLTCHTALPPELIDTKDIEQYIIERKEDLDYQDFSFKKNMVEALVKRIQLTTPGYDPQVDLLPDMVSKDIEIITTGVYRSTGDIVLSTLGWIGISGKVGGRCHLRTWMPSAIGCCYRTPALVPHMSRQRRKRIGRTREFEVAKVVK